MGLLISWTVGTIYFQYGTTTSYGSQTPAGDMGEPAGSVSYTVNSLSLTRFITIALLVL